MLGIGEVSGVYLALRPVDFRRGIGALSRYAREYPGVEPDTGVVLVLRSRRPGRARVLQNVGANDLPLAAATGTDGLVVVFRIRSGEPRSAARRQAPALVYPRGRGETRKCRSPIEVDKSLPQEENSAG